MKSLVRIAAVVLGVVILLFGLIAAYLAFIFDPNDYRERISSEVEKHTGRSFAIEGDIGLSVFPWLGVEIGRAQLGNAPGFGDAPFARVEEVEVRARLMPLLRSELEVDRVVLRGMELNLERKADGHTNWDDLAARGKGTATEEPARSSPGEAVGAVGAIVVAGVEIADARVRFADRQAGTEYAINGFALKTGEVRPGKRFALEIGFDVTVSEPALAGRVDLKGDVLVDVIGPKLDIDGFELAFSGKGAALPGGEAKVVMNAEVALDMTAGTASIDDLVMRAYEVEVRGQMVGKGLNASPGFSGSLEVPELDPRKLLAALDVDVPKAADDKVLRKASFSSRIEATRSSLNLRDIVAVLDDSRLTGELAVADFAKRALRFDLALDAINVDRYVPPSEGKDKKPGDGAGAAAAALDPAVLRGLDVVGKLAVGKLIASGLTMSDLSVEVRAQGGVLRLEPLAAKLYEGRYAGNASFDGRGQTLAVALGNTLSGVQIGPLLRDMAGAEERLTGSANLDSRLQARGNDADAIKRTLGGNVDFRFLDGSVKGINIAQYLRQAQARISGKSAPESSEPNQTDFSQLTGTLQIADGVARNDDLDLRSPLLRVGGKGSVNLPRETIDYVVRASVVASLAGQGGEGLDNLKGVTVPIKVSGTFAKPSFGLDLESLVTDQVKQQARERLEGAVQEKLPPQLQDSLQKGLGGFLRR